MASSKYKYEWKPRRRSGGMRTIHDPVILEQRLFLLEETHRDVINEWAQFDSIAQRLEHKLRIHFRVKHFVDGLVRGHSSMTKGEAMWSATEAFGKSIEAIRGAYYYEQRTVVKEVR
jgi:hypothetical protein